jgi:hypothetical protein
MPVCLLPAAARLGKTCDAMRTAAFIHPTSVSQPTTGTGGSLARERRDLVRESLRAVPGPTWPTHRRWA